jgi:RimJ/RimL family protein N-acetyltransferase
VATSVQLRPVVKSDIAQFFEHHLELRPLPAGASVADLEARKATFVDRWEQMLSDKNVMARTIIWKDAVAGYVARLIQRDKPSISCWLGRDYWGKGVATQAVQAFLDLIEKRPIYARVAYDNLAAMQVLRKIGFEIVEHDSFFSDAHGYEIDEIILALS